MLLVITLVVLFPVQQTWTSCTPAKDAHGLDLSSLPTLEMNNLEFPNEYVLPTGYNISVICISNHSAAGNTYYTQPFWIKYFFNGAYKIDNSCGGSDGKSDSEASKVCIYFIQNSTEEHSGNYTCHSYNQMGCTKDTMTLMFKKPSPPRFSDYHPREFNFTEGSKAILSCKASGIPRPVITWFKDSYRIPSSSVRGAKGYSILTFESVHPRDQGHYWCEANSTEGWNRSSSMNLKVLWKPIFSIHPSSMSAYLDDVTAVVNLSCVANGFPPPVISWLQNNSTVNDGTVTQTGTISSLTVVLNKRTIQPLKYRCVARNSLGNTFSQEATVTIAKRKTELRNKDRMTPKFYRHPKSVVASRHDTAEFTCAARGFLRPNVTWRKDGKEFTDKAARIFQRNMNQSSEVVMRILSVSERHLGYYTCRAAILDVSVPSKEAQLSLKADDAVTTDHVSAIIWSTVGIGAFLVIIITTRLAFKLKRERRANCQLNKDTIKNKQEVLELQITNTKDIINQLRDNHSPLIDDAQHREPTTTENDVVDNELYLQSMAVNRNWEIPRDRLTITEEKLGGGEFGIVNKGIYLRTDGNELPVAVKRLKDNTNKQQRLALIKELETLIDVGRHPNIVSLVGACTFEEPLYVVIEFVSGGSLDKLLRSSRVQTQPADVSYVNIWSKLTERELLRIASDVASGMRHLESKQCIHRDLACRNVLVGKGLVAKVADFGMARDISTDGQYIKTTEGRIPWLWMSMEALRGTCTTKADVWSFGVTLWEIVTLGKLPYAGVKGILELHELLQDGVRLQKPPHCSDELYNIMLRCWQRCPDERPSFEQLHVMLHEILKHETRTYINVTYFEEQRKEGRSFVDINHENRLAFPVNTDDNECSELTNSEICPLTEHC